MTSLHDFQSAFTALMLDHPDALKTPPAIVSEALETGDIALDTRLAVYRNNIVGSLTDVMAESFSLILKLVGKEFFEGIARSFILKNPPRAGCLNTFGDGFAEFIETFAPAKTLPYLPDMARLEIALNRAYYARDEKPLSAEALAAQAPEALESLLLNLKDSVTLMQSAYPLSEIRALCLDETQPSPDMQQGESLMILRLGDTPELVRLEPGEFKLLTLLETKTPLGVAVAAVLEEYPHFNMAEFLQKHFHLETFSQGTANKDT